MLNHISVFLRILWWFSTACGIKSSFLAWHSRASPSHFVLLSSFYCPYISSSTIYCSHITPFIICWKWLVLWGSHVCLFFSFLLLSQPGIVSLLGLMLYLFHRVFPSHPTQINHFLLYLLACICITALISMCLIVELVTAMFLSSTWLQLPSS